MSPQVGLATMAPRLRAPRFSPGALGSAARPDAEAPWIPHNILPLATSRVFGSLPAAPQLRYNHLYAMMMAEQFIWLEYNFAIVPIGRLLRSAKGDTRRVIQSFRNDEISHNNALWELLRRSAPELYPRQHHLLFKPPPRVLALATEATRAPRTCPAWILFLIFPEEHTIELNRAYRRAERCDALFTRAHWLHAQDEARHCRIDSLLADWLMAPLSTDQRTRVESIVARLFKAYYGLDWGHDLPVRQLVREFPELRPLQRQLIDDAAGARGPDYFRHLFATQTAPLSLRVAQRHPELGAAMDRLLH